MQINDRVITVLIFLSAIITLFGITGVFIHATAVADSPHQPKDRIGRPVLKQNFIPIRTYRRIQTSMVGIKSDTPTEFSSPGKPDPTVETTPEPTVPSANEPSPHQDETSSEVSTPPKLPSEAPLLRSVNDFRAQNNTGQLAVSDELCTIASSRLRELRERQELDNHEGFSKYFQNQSTFARMGETIYYSSGTVSDSEIVRNGWGESPGHREQLLSTSYTSGCGARNDQYAVFILGIPR